MHRQQPAGPPVTPTVRQGQHDHMLIGRNEIGVQRMIKVFADELGIALG
jgi:choline monooxygenase